MFSKQIGSALVLTIIAMSVGPSRNVRASSTAPVFPVVTLIHVPNGGIQPQVAVDASGVAHLIYLKGDPAACDVYYVRSADGGVSWSAPARVNSQPGSAIALGTVRGAHLALGAGHLHVAWMGSKAAEPRAPGNAAPMLYTRCKTPTATGEVAFDPQRNVIAAKPGVDGGGSVAADEHDHVYVAWHAPDAKGGGEAGRRVFAAISSDDGATFATEIALSDQPSGACACCGLDIHAGTDGRIYALYRAATEQVDRDVYLISADNLGEHGGSAIVGPTRVSTCLMSTAALATGPRGVVGAWELKDRMEWGLIDPADGKLGAVVEVPATGAKHPAVAVNAQGETLLAWAQGTGWNKGGAVAWQVYDSSNKPLGNASGSRPGLAVWGKPAAFAKPDGSFVILY